MSPQEGVENNTAAEAYHSEKEGKTEDPKDNDEEGDGEETTPGENGCEKEATPRSLGANNNDNNDNDNSSGSINDKSDGTTPMQYHNPSFDQVSRNEGGVPSPAPVVEKGGDNEFVKVSHLASVQVKAVPIQGILKSKNHPLKKNSFAARRIKLPRRSDSNSTDSLSSRGSPRHNRKRSDNNSNHLLGDTATTTGTSTSTYTSLLNGAEDASLGKFMKRIEKSPYEPGGCAERGESIFRKMKKLLLEDAEMTPQIIHMFGESNAECLKKASALVDKSGMVYSQTWTKGSIRGNPVGIIPNHLLLLVLVQTRFVKASELLLSGMCRDLEVYASVNRALDTWEWGEKYKLVRATKKNYKFKTNKRDCFKCAVFVARAHSCYLAFGKRELESGLIDKMTACLDIMESHLVDPSSIGSGYNGYATAAASTPVAATPTSSKKRKLPTPDAVFSASPAVPLSTSASSSGSSSTTSGTKSKSAAHNSNHHHNYHGHDTPVVKRKRGRPPKNAMQQITQQQRSLASATPVEASPAFQSKEENTEEESMSSSASSRHNRDSQSSRTKGGNVNGNVAGATTASMPCAPHGVSLRRPDPSLQELMSRFEDQYNEMGRRYTEMGTLLAQMKNALAVNRERSEQEVRRELLDEVQKSLLESLPKR